MMSPGTIEHLQREAEKVARAKGRVPLVLEAGETNTSVARKGNIPFLGEYVPPGWRRTERKEFFVDTSGFGREDEPALTVEQFLAQVTPGKGYAVTMQGQFQAYVAEYEQV